MLELQELYKKFKDHCVIKNLSYCFSETGVSILVGINGSGKTTLLHMISNLLLPDSGIILLDGLTPNSKEYKSKLFYVPSDFYLPEYMTGLEYCDFILSKYETGNHEMLECMISLLELSEAKDWLIETYSFGMKQKLQIALAIACNVKYLILDEVLNGLDLETKILIQEIISIISQNKKIIIVTHDKNTIERFSSDVLLLQNGSIVSYNHNKLDLYDFMIQEGGINAKICKFKKYI